MEIKAKSKNQEFARNYLLKHATLIKGTDLQIDTYFNTERGRLKLREGNIENSLIYYQRSNTADTKQSDVNLLKLAPNSGIKEILTKSNGVKVVVKKSREIYFIKNVKFHIDKVEGLGDFIEIEAIDTDGSISKDQLKQQCDYYSKELQIEKSDLISVSYSDLILEKAHQFYMEMNSKFKNFVYEVDQLLSDKKLKVFDQHIDHVCYRVDSMESYEFMKIKFSCIGYLLTESIIGERPIATFKLHKPLIAENDLKVFVVELPAPKQKNKYHEGFEHLEVVISKSFEDLSKEYENLQFDWSGASKKINSELRIKLNDKFSIKFHHQRLEDVIREELLTNN